MSEASALIQLNEPRDPVPALDAFYGVWKLLSELVQPDTVPAETVEGEIVRTIDRILYDLMDGAEHTARLIVRHRIRVGAMNYLTDSHLIPRKVRYMFNDWAERYQNEDYSGQTAACDQLMKIAVDYIEGKESLDYVKNADYLYRTY